MKQTEIDAYYGVARWDLLEMLETRGPERALEVGCGLGANLIEIKRRNPTCHTVGIELNGEAARLARERTGIDELFEADAMDRQAIHFESGSFDLIILSHVLEHLAQPEQLLQRCKAWLKADGLMLVALPNVRHVTVLIDLALRGDFRYQVAGGILDQTHLRFFTRLSARRLFEEQGLRVLNERADIEGRRSRLLDTLSFGLAREFSAFAYNFLVGKAC